MVLTVPPNGETMNFFSTAIAIEQSRVLAVTLQILACIVAAVWLTAAGDLLITHLIDWVGVR